MDFILDSEINEVVDSLIKSYDSTKEIDKTLSFDPPDKNMIVQILNKLKKLIFVGYFRNDTYRVYTVKNNISMLAEDIIFNLSKQIAKVLECVDEYKDYSVSAINNISRGITLEFMKRIPKIREYIETDVEAAYSGDPAAYSKAEIVLSYPGLFAIMVNRIAHELYLLKVPLIPRMMTEHAHSRTGIDIHPGATIGKYFFIDHGTGIVIGETTVIGDYVKIYQGVTLGALSTRDVENLKNTKRHPTIEDCVTIYSGASILGGNTVIGKNVVIGGNCFITQSIPEGARVSIKAQELRIKQSDTKKREIEKVELEPDGAWFYVI